MRVWPFTSRAGGSSVCLLLDIGGTSAAVALLLRTHNASPVLGYAKRVPITAHEGEAPEAALGRALTLLAEALGSEGMIATRAAGGASRVGEALIALDAPWQHTRIRIEEKRSETPFTFTKRVLAEILRTSERTVGEGKGLIVEQHVVGIRLNGYATKNPVGESARRAALIILISSMLGTVVESVTKLIGEKFHVRGPTFMSGVTLRYRVLSDSFPHDRDLLILDAAAHAGALSLVRAHTLVAIRQFPSGSTEAEWMTAVMGGLQEVATSYPLPRLILLVADEKDVHEKLATLQAGGLDQLWVTEEPPKIVPVSRIPNGTVTLAHEALPDIRLSLMAEYVVGGASPYAQ